MWHNEGLSRVRSTKKLHEINAKSKLVQKTRKQRKIGMKLQRNNYVVASACPCVCVVTRCSKWKKACMCVWKNVAEIGIEVGCAYKLVCNAKTLPISNERGISAQSCVRVCAEIFCNANMLTSACICMCVPAPANC